MNYTATITTKDDVCEIRSTPVFNGEEFRIGIDVKIEPLDSIFDSVKIELAKNVMINKVALARRMLDDNNYEYVKEYFISTKVNRELLDDKYKEYKREIEKNFQFINK